MKVIMEGPEEHAEAARERLVKCMKEPFIKNRTGLLQLVKDKEQGKHVNEQEWDACYHCGMRLELTVDADTANTWYDAK
jgi:hypothetical protein